MPEPADILVYIQGKGIVLKEKSLAAVDTTCNKFIAFGNEAAHMAEDLPGTVEIISPLRRGMISDFFTAEQLFAHLMLKALGKKPLRKPAVAVCVPKGINMVEKKAVEDALYMAGAREVLIADWPVEQLVQHIRESSDKNMKKFKIIIGITKDEPEKYIKEELSEILQYAQQEGIPAQKVEELLHLLPCDIQPGAGYPCTEGSEAAGTDRYIY